MTQLTGKAVVVTGAGRGIGAAIARHLSTLGARVVVNDVDGAMAEDIATAIRVDGGTAIAHVADITDWDKAEELTDGCIAAFGRIDGLVNNAGLFSMGRIEEIERGEAERLLSVNVVGTVNCATHAARRMRARRNGVIVNVVSGAQMGIPAMGLYGATKGAVASLTYAWAIEMADHGVRVNALSPMAVTRMADVTDAYRHDRGETDQPRAAAAAEANAPAAAYLLSDLSRDVNGQILRVDGNRLSLMSHPAVILPTLERRDGWTIKDIDAAMRGPLAARITPVGFTGMTIAEYGIPLSIWADGPAS